MTSSRYSKATTLALLAVLALSVAMAPVAAVEVAESDTPASAEAGTQISASYTLDNLYQSPNWGTWTLNGETELENVTWTLTFIDAQGNEFNTTSYDGQTFSQPNISTESDILTIRVDVTGEVPAVQEDDLTYPDEETFVVASLTQRQGQQGATNDVGTWEAHHYTTAEGEDEYGTQAARQALDDARAAIDNASAVGADVSTANSTYESAVSAYESGNFGNAVDLANRAQDEANEAKESKEQSEQTSQMLLYGGIGLVVLLLVGGGVYYWRNQEDEYDKLG